MNYVPKPIDMSEIKLPEDIEKLTEILARNTHETWAKKRLDDGWVFSHCMSNVNKTHPGLVPYDELSEEEKEYDRYTAITAIKLIVKLGYRIDKIII